MTTLDLIGVTKDAKTAGPGKRFELFTKGCIRGVINPCVGCFNEETWTFDGPRKTLEVKELADIIQRDAWNRQVTFCGGEPMIQAAALTALAKELKSRDPKFHIIMYTAYKLDTLMQHGLSYTWTKKQSTAMRDLLSKHSFSEVRKKAKSEFQIVTPRQVIELMENVDIIVDGDFQIDKRMTTDKYMHEGWFVGSTNQRVIFTKSTVAFFDIENGKMNYMPAQEYNDWLQRSNLCKGCGHPHKRLSDFCSDVCNDQYITRVAFLNREGLAVKKGVY